MQSDSHFEIPEIVSGTEIPPDLGYRNRAWWRRMQIGDRVTVGHLQRNRMQSAFSKVGWGFKSQNLRNGSYHVWRVEPKESANE